MNTTEDATKDSTKDSTKDTKQAATSPPAGAVHADASSGKGQQAFGKSKGLQLAPAVEQEWVPTRRPSLGDTKPQSVPPTLKEEPYDPDTDGEDVTLGAVRVPGRDGEEDGRTVISTLETHMILQATVVKEEDTERLNQEERVQLEEDFRRRIHEEQIGQVPQAEIVEDDGTKMMRRWVFICTGIVVILLSIILGTLFGTRDTSTNAVSVSETTAPTISSVPSKTPSLRPSPSPTVAPLNNNICEEASPIDLGDTAIEASLQKAIRQFVVFCEFPEQSPDSRPGLWYKVSG